MAFMIEIILPFPNMALSPNRKNGKSWQSTQALKDRAIQDGFYHAKNVPGELLKASEYKLTLIFYKPQNRKKGYDWDNLSGAWKPTQDGICKALNIDDGQFNPITIDRRYKKGYSATIVTIEENND